MSHAMGAGFAAESSSRISWRNPRHAPFLRPRHKTYRCYKRNVPDAGSPLETRALRYFQTVAEFGSYSRGSEFLRISQPAVSRQIRKLEEEFGHALFKRHGHGVSLTDAGRILLERSQVALQQD